MAERTENPKMKHIYFMLRCTKDRHPNCIPMRNATMKSSKKILQAYTTDIELDGVRYCVTGKALVRDGEVKDFAKNLWKIKSQAARPTGVKELKVLVSQQ